MNINKDIYQINLTREFTLGKIKSPYELFLNYYQTQPVDFGSFFEFHDHSIVSGSMELFIKKSGKNITTKPIKGTASINSVDDKNLKGVFRNVPDRTELSTEINENLIVDYAMRYGNPSIKSKMLDLQKSGCENIIILMGEFPLEINTPTRTIIIIMF